MDSWGPATISQGYSSEFTSPPPSRGSSATLLPLGTPQCHALAEETAALLHKRAIVPVLKDAMTSSFQSSVFLAPKREPSKWRPVVNIKPLNKFIGPQHFRIKTLGVILRSRVGQHPSIYGTPTSMCWSRDKIASTFASSTTAECTSFGCFCSDFQLLCRCSPVLSEPLPPIFVGGTFSSSSIWMTG